MSFFYSIQNSCFVYGFLINPPGGAWVGSGGFPVRRIDTRTLPGRPASAVRPPRTPWRVKRQDPVHPLASGGRCELRKAVQPSRPGAGGVVEILIWDPDPDFHLDARAWPWGAGAPPEARSGRGRRVDGENLLVRHARECAGAAQHSQDV